METARTLLSADGTPLRYRVWRPGAPRRLLVLLHGLASNLTRWSEFVALTRLRDSWDILRVDLRGHAGSLDRGRLGMDEWCADLAAILAAEAPRATQPGRVTVILVGHCLGANVAAEFACRQPGVVSGLVLIEPVFAEALRGSLRLAAALRPLVVPVVWLVRALNALGVHRRRTRPLDLEGLDRKTRGAMAAGAGDALMAGYASPWTDLASTPTAAYLQSLVALGRGVPDLSGLSLPVLALLSTGGAFGDPAITERQLARLPRCRVLRLEARHWIPTERPDEMRHAIEAWCQEIVGP